MMKTAVLVLALAFAVLQTVALADCPCGAFCRTPNQACAPETPQTGDC